MRGDRLAGPRHRRGHLPHEHRGGRSAAGAGRAPPPWIRHVQLSDSNRLEPGAGHLDWAAPLRTLGAIGYAGELAYECRLSGDVDEVLPASVQRMRQLAWS